MSFKKLLLLLLFFAVFGAGASHAQTKKKATTQKTVAVKKSKSRKTQTITPDDREYYNGHKLYTGLRGGRYDINRNGNKIYI
ncbi:hypothetical protein [Niabella drilacis]|uniref:PBCV-specific basic adaptor domain-containing protein n=1 Tax=Niabella drilacis (strain DSM 25811 / CCM 8410 / CCUG 62505 / LMG 26954 / E90) TaxID=1285928 RepID=A0A1G6MTU0_NIADE|nr:hypothetical protein [Niabella drilacis]SDC58841.1 hypothetical protein SAMN04487894_10333 [Niabella drilacis]